VNWLNNEPSKDLQTASSSDADQDDVGEVDDDDGGRDEQLATLEEPPVEHDRQREGDGASKSAVGHHELADAVQLGHTHQVREVVQYHDHCHNTHTIE